MENHAHHTMQLLDCTSPIEPLPFSVSDLGEDEISDTQSFDEDDMYGLDSEDDTVATLLDSEDDIGSPIPEPERDLQTLGDVILALLESADDVQTSIIGIVCHQMS